MDQEALVKHFQTGDILAFEALYNLYRKNICGVVHAIVRNQSLAEELTQDVFVKAWNNANDYNPSKGRFFSWILNIARQAAQDELNGNPDEKTTPDLSPDYIVSLLNGKGDDSMPDSDNLKKLTKSITKKNIQIIELLYFNGSSEKEVSDKLGISPKTIMRRNRKTIFKLRENMTFEWI